MSLSFTEHRQKEGPILNVKYVEIVLEVIVFRKMWFTLLYGAGYVSELELVFAEMHPLLVIYFPMLIFVANSDEETIAGYKT